MADVVLPQWGMGMQEGTVVDWLVTVGAHIDEGDDLVEIEAEKVTDTVKAPMSGVVSSITREAGTTVLVSEVLCVIEPDGGGNGAALDQVVVVDVRAGDLPPSSPHRDVPSGAAVQIEPRARKLMLDHQIDAASVSGTGNGGRITESDVRAVLPPDAPASERSSPSARRGVIARQMMESLHGMAQLTITRRADVTVLLERREQVPSEDRVGFAIDIAASVARCLRELPELNAQYVDGRLHICSDVHLGMAFDHADGLLVLVLRDADRRSPAQLHETWTHLREQAERGALAAADLTGSTFTITNLGHLGVEFFTPIINPPEVAILGVGCGALAPMPGPDGGLSWRHLLPLSLTFDHRVIDGAPAARFLERIANYLESGGTNE